MATSGTILNGQLPGTSEEGQPNGYGLGGKAAFITFRQSQLTNGSHVAPPPLRVTPHSDFLSFPTFLFCSSVYVEQIPEASIPPRFSTHYSFESKLITNILTVPQTSYFDTFLSFSLKYFSQFFCCTHESEKAEIF